MTELYPYFTRAELSCRCGCGDAEVDPLTIGKLIRLRRLCGFPFPITSGKRCGAHNARVSDTGYTGPHTTGKAFDIAACGYRARLIVAGASLQGFLLQLTASGHVRGALALLLRWLARWAGQFAFSGVGISQHGETGARYVHLDDCAQTPAGPRPWFWSYP